MIYAVIIHISARGAAWGHNKNLLLTCYLATTSNTVQTAAKTRHNFFDHLERNIWSDFLENIRQNIFTTIILITNFLVEIPKIVIYVVQENSDGERRLNQGWAIKVSNPDGVGVELIENNLLWVWPGGNFPLKSEALTLLRSEFVALPKMTSLRRFSGWHPIFCTIFQANL